MDIELSDADFQDIIFPYPESDIIEYKQTINAAQYPKYVETICALLNNNGGYLIFGICDDSKCTGLFITDNKIDKFICWIDSIIPNQSILENNETLSTNTIKCHRIYVNNKQFVIIEMKPQLNSRYKMADGRIYERLGASNYYIKDRKLYTEHEITHLKQSMDAKHNENIHQIKQQYIKLKQELDQKDNELKKHNENIKRIRHQYDKLFSRLSILEQELVDTQIHVIQPMLTTIDRLVRPKPNLFIIVFWNCFLFLKRKLRNAVE